MSMDESRASANDTLIVNRGPICATCRYLRIVDVEIWPSVERTERFGLLFLRKRRVKVPAQTHRVYQCSIARDIVSGMSAHDGWSCEDERQNIAGCGPEGKNWVHNPDWIKALSESGKVVHPDLQALIDSEA